MVRLLVTGASGYIGQRLCEVATGHGYEVVVLGSRPTTKCVRAFAWRIGEEPPPEAFVGVTAVIHLAHSWANDAQYGTSSANINLSGSETLARAALATDVSRLIFASTTSARLGALNAYGRIKYALEQKLMALPGAAGRVACARIGLVYGGPERGLYGLLSKLVRLSPLLPMIGLDRKVQPIYIDEVVAGLLSLAAGPLPQRDGGLSNVFVLAGPEPITFETWIRLVRRSQTGKQIWLVPIPLQAALIACDFSRLIPFFPTVSRERVLGLVGTEPMSSAIDVAALHIRIVPPINRLLSLRAEHKQIIAEAMAMLAYVSGKQVPPKATVVRLVRGIERQSVQSLGLPRLVTRFPALLRVFEPFRPNLEHKLAQRLHLAVMVVESSQIERRGGTIASIGQVFLEAVAAPFRLIFGRYYA